MLKPWVVQFLLWFYKIGLLLVLAGVVRLRWQSRVSGPRNGKLAIRSILWLAGFWIVVGLAGKVVGFTLLTLVFAQYAVIAFALLSAIYTGSDFLPLAIIGLVILALGGVYVGRFVFDDSMNEQLPKWERRLSPTLLCRVYPKRYDSLMGTRLALVRETGGWLRDEVVGELTYGQEAEQPACTMTTPSNVELRLSFKLSEQNVTKSIALN